MNHMEGVATLLGLKLYERFKIECHDGTFFIDENGLVADNSDNDCNCDLANLLNGKYKIIKRSWEPNVGEGYYYCTLNFASNLVRLANFDPHRLEDAYNIKVGNCFPTKGEAEQYLTVFKEWIDDGTKIDQWRNKE